MRFPSSHTGPRTVTSTFLLLTALTFATPGVAANASAQDASQDGLREFVSSVGEFLYAMAWPTAEYQGIRVRGIHRVSNGVDLRLQVYGLSSFSGGSLWTNLVLEIRDGRVHDLRWGRHNAILAQPGQTVAALGDFLIELSRQYEQSSGTSSGRGAAAEWDLRPAIGQFRVTNSCRDPVRLAVWFRDLSGRWVLEGWWRFDSGQTSYLTVDGRRISSRTKAYFFYAESTNGSRRSWRGEQRTTFQGQTLEMRRMEDSAGDYGLDLTCNT